MSGLRQRRHAETKQAIVDAAFNLFEHHGFTTTLMEQIAEHAGVSRSTLYRRYSSKEDIVLDVPRQWLATWDAAVSQLPADAPLKDSLAAGCLAVAETIDESSDRVLRALQALSESAALQASGGTNKEWLDRVASLIGSRAPELSLFDCLTIAGAYMGAIDTMMQQWAASGGTESVVDATDRVLDRLAPILMPSGQ